MKHSLRLCVAELKGGSPPPSKIVPHRLTEICAMHGVACVYE